MNKVLLREHYTMPTTDILHDLRQSKVFTKADLSSGYWHIKLDEYSSDLTNFSNLFWKIQLVEASIWTLRVCRNLSEKVKGIVDLKL